MDMQAINRRVIEQFRAGGPVEGMHRERLLLLTTTGARSGLPRTTPMMFVRVGEQLLVIASAAGAAEDPRWYQNLVAEPRATAELADATLAVRAVTLTGAERERVWTAIVAGYPFFAEHQARVARTIPVVVLEPVELEA
jgi:deazaflavin-dependent oxidoreductase (nitroreductase family)